MSTLLKSLSMVTMAFGLSACGAFYFSPQVKPGDTNGVDVKVVPMTPASIVSANTSPYYPISLPDIFYRTANSASGLGGAGEIPDPVFDLPDRPGIVSLSTPPSVTPGPYNIGVGDVLLFASPDPSATVEQLSGLLFSEGTRRGYTVQDDGAIAIPNIGRVQVADLTLEEAEANVFQALVEANIDPTFSLEIAEFNSKRVAFGGAVGKPGVLPITLTPLFLDAALASVGGVTARDPDTTTIRIYRDGSLYQIPLNDFFSQRGLERLPLLEGDSVFVDTGFDLDLAEAYFQQQITLLETRQGARASALDILAAEINIHRGILNEARANFAAKVDLDAVERDYVYLTGEVGRQNRFTMPFGRKASLADALFSDGEGVPTETGNVREIYVLRDGHDGYYSGGGITAYHLDARNAATFVLATRFELRPNDVIFVAEQPVTRWSRVVRQITPALITTTVGAATN